MKNTCTAFAERKISPKIVLTADETMMSKYRWGIFIGFSTCMPQGIFPEWFYFSVFSPPVPRKNGRAVYADFGLRIVESCLAEVFGEDEVAVVHPRDLEHVVGSRTEIIGISGHDFLGINPPTSEFVDIVDTGPPYNRVKFFELMRKPVMKEKIVVAGGKAAWQFTLYRYNSHNRNHFFLCILSGNIQTDIRQIKWTSRPFPSSN